MTTKFLHDDKVCLLMGDCIERLKSIPDGAVDAIVTDPPYGLEFMGKEWDAPWKESDVSRANRGTLTNMVSPNGQPKFQTKAPAFDLSKEAARGFQEWCGRWVVECLRVLKPGGYLLSFGGTRTYHRMACAIEDAGFEIRDSLHWIYGSGFPKSHDIAIAIDKQAGAMGHRGKAHHAYAYGDDFQGRELDAPKIVEKHTGITDEAKKWVGWGTALKPSHEPVVVARKPFETTVAANVLAHGTGALNIDGTRVEFQSDADKAAAKPQGRATAKSGALAGGTQNGNARTEFAVNQNAAGRWPSNTLLAHAIDCGDTCSESCPVREIDSQAAGVSRFFPGFRYQSKVARKERGEINDHPTVKPIALMEWLITLVTPPGGVVLDPFMGSGTTGVACVRKGFEFLGIEREESYFKIAEARIAGEDKP